MQIAKVLDQLLHTKEELLGRVSALMKENILHSKQTKLMSNFEKLLFEAEEALRQLQNEHLNVEREFQGALKEYHTALQSKALQRLWYTFNFGASEIDNAIFQTISPSREDLPSLKSIGNAAENRHCKVVYSKPSQIAKSIKIKSGVGIYSCGDYDDDDDDDDDNDDDNADSNNDKEVSKNLGKNDEIVTDTTFQSKGLSLSAQDFRISTIAGTGSRGWSMLPIIFYIFCILVLFY